MNPKNPKVIEVKFVHVQTEQFKESNCNCAKEINLAIQNLQNIVKIYKKKISTIFYNQEAENDKGLDSEYKGPGRPCGSLNKKTLQKNEIVKEVWNTIINIIEEMEGFSAKIEELDALNHKSKSDLSKDIPGEVSPVSSETGQAKKARKTRSDKVKRGPYKKTAHQAGEAQATDISSCDSK